jgi:hypothetical protein
MVQEDGSLYDLGAYIHWPVHSESITLDGQFEIDDLKEIVRYIRMKQSEKV